MCFVELGTLASERRHIEKKHYVSGMLFARVSGRPLFDLFLCAGLHACHRLRPIVRARFTDAAASVSVVAGPGVNVVWERCSPQR